jgi:hypothetical protein
MIISGRSRQNGKQLGRYLVAKGENERVTPLEIRGSMSDNVPGAVLEMSLRTELTKRGKLGLYHAHIAPAYGEDQLTPEQWRAAADRLEQELGLVGQNRVVVLHEKKGKVHGHVVWQREREGKLIKMSHSYRAHDRARAALEKELTHKPTRQVGDHKKELSRLWVASRTGADFVRQAEAAGYRVARGDRRAYVVETADGQKLDLVRQLEGVKTKAAKERLAPIEGKLRSESELVGRTPQREGARQRMRRDQERTGPANDNQPTRSDRVREAGQTLGDVVRPKDRQPGEAERFDQQLAAMRENMKPDPEQQKAQERENAQDTTESEADRFARKLEEYRREQEAKQRGRDHDRT